MRTPFTGVGTAIVTPFTKALALDEDGVRRLARRQIDEGIHFLVPCGTTGESPTLSEDERTRIVQICVEEARGKVPVLAGAGGYDTSEVIHAARQMERAGADGLLSVTPYYNKPTPDGLIQHYKAIADSTPLPIVVYNVPGRTGCNVDPATLVKLAAIPNIVGVKEASGNIQQMCEICRSVPSDFIVLSGDDAITLPLMSVGGRGVISVASNEVPRAMSQMVEAAERGDFAAARKLHAALLPLMLVNFVESNPIPVKAAMAAMGLLDEVYRLPMVPPRAESRAKIVAVLKRDGPCERRVSQGERVSDSTVTQLSQDIERLYQQGASADKNESRTVFATLREELSAGRVRAAEPDASAQTGWRVNTWVKQGILVGFRCGDLVDVSIDGPLVLRRQGHAAAEEDDDRDGRARRARRIVDPRWRVRGERRHLRAADVHQHRRVRRRIEPRRFACARRIVRAGRQARPHQRGSADRRRHRAGRRDSSRHRG